MRYLITLFIVLLFLPGGSVQGAQDRTSPTVADFDHSDPIIRAAFLNRVEKSIIKGDDYDVASLLAELVVIWQSPDQVDDLRDACQRLYDVLLRSEGLYQSNRQAVEPCPQDMRDTQENRIIRTAEALRKVSPNFRQRIGENAAHFQAVVKYSIDSRGKTRNLQIVCSNIKGLNSGIIGSVRNSIFRPAMGISGARETPAHYSYFTISWQGFDRYGTIIVDFLDTPPEEAPHLQWVLELGDRKIPRKGFKTCTAAPVE